MSVSLNRTEMSGMPGRLTIFFDHGNGFLSKGHMTNTGFHKISSQNHRHLQISGSRCLPLAQDFCCGDTGNERCRSPERQNENAWRLKKCGAILSARISLLPQSLKNVQIEILRCFWKNDSKELTD